MKRFEQLTRAIRIGVIAMATVTSPTLSSTPAAAENSDTAIRPFCTRNGFTPVVREQLFKKFRGLEIEDCPFVNLPEAKSGRWGAGLTAAKMKDCRWLKPVLVAQIEFLEWTGENHLRHSKFMRCATTNRHARLCASSARLRCRAPHL